MDTSLLISDFSSKHKARGILSSGGWEKIEMNAQTPNGDKYNLYYLKDKTAEKVEKARQALEKEEAEKGREFLDGTEFLAESIDQSPYLAKEGKELYLITKEKAYKILVDYYNKSFNHPQNDEILNATNHSHTAECYALNGKLEAALEEYTKCLTILTRLNDQKSLAGTYYNIGCLCQKLGKTDAARHNFLECITISQELKFRGHFFRSSYLSLGTIYYKENDFSQALEYFQEYKKIAEEEKAFEDIQKGKELVNLCLSKI